MTERRLEYMRLDALEPAKRNPKQHDIATLGKSVERFGFTEPIVLDERTQRLVAGHGRREALLKMRAGKEDAPEGVRVTQGEWLVPVLRGWASRSDTEADAYLLASNQLTMAGGWDDDALEAMLKELSELQALDGVGWDEKELDKLLSASGEDSEYTGKVESPVYKPTGEKPAVADLYKAEKQGALAAEIAEADVTEDERAFLLAAAQRHIVFDYQNITEYYAHASLEMQRLMERSALVIIDFKQAIENGFVKMTESLVEAFADEGHEG